MMSTENKITTLANSRFKCCVNIKSRYMDPGDRALIDKFKNNQ